jgi:hypothetical protein
MIYKMYTQAERQKGQTLRGEEHSEFYSKLQKKYETQCKQAIDKLPPVLRETLTEQIKVAFRVSDMMAETGDVYMSDAHALKDKTYDLFELFTSKNPHHTCAYHD